jgi:hypothetical protein
MGAIRENFMDGGFTGVVKPTARMA